MEKKYKGKLISFLIGLTIFIIAISLFAYSQIYYADWLEKHRWLFLPTIGPRTTIYMPPISYLSIGIGIFLITFSGLFFYITYIYEG